MSATPIKIKNDSANIFVLGLRTMNSATEPDAPYMTAIEMSTAAIITSTCCTIPIAVTMESIENTRSINAICTMTRRMPLALLLKRRS